MIFACTVDKEYNNDILFISPRGGYERSDNMCNEHKHQHQSTKKSLIECPEQSDIWNQLKE